MSQTYTRRSGRDDAAITVRMGLSRNPMMWILPTFRGSLLLAFLVLGGWLIWVGRGEPACFGMLFLLIGLPIAFSFIRHNFAANRSIVWFDEAGIEVLERIPGGHHNGFEEFAFTDLGHIELVSMSEIKLQLRSERFDEVRMITLRVDATAGEDLFDSILDYIDKHAPGHLYSIYENKMIRYSREFELAELYPNQMEPSERFSLIELDDRRSLVKPTDEHVLARHGLVLATVEGLAYRELVVHLCDESDYHLWGNGELHRAGERIGKFEPNNNRFGRWRYTLELEQPIPAIVAEILLVAFEHGRERLRL